MGYPAPTYQNGEVQREIQRGFLRKVYGILCLQLLCTVGMCWAVMAHPGAYVSMCILCGMLRCDTSHRVDGVAISSESVRYTPAINSFVLANGWLGWATFIPTLVRPCLACDNTTQNLRLFTRGVVCALSRCRCVRARARGDGRCVHVSVSSS